MTRIIFQMVLVLCLTFTFGPLAFGQFDEDLLDDDDFLDDDDMSGGEITVQFDQPSSLVPDNMLRFVLNITYENASSKGFNAGEWILSVDLAMPSGDYEVNETTLAPPDPLHTDIDRWEVYFDAFNTTITWQSFSVVSSGASAGDIREGDTQLFEFDATPDDNATDGFPYILYGDKGSVESGVVYISGTSDDDDASGDDDTGPTYDDDDEFARQDEDTGGGCGC